jgi:hypothetical protein
MARTLRLDGNFVPKNGNRPAVLSRPPRRTFDASSSTKPAECHGWDLPPEPKPRLRDRLIQFINSALMD